MNFFKELVKRLTLPTPAFFTKLMWFGGVLVALGLGIQAMEVDGSVILGFLKPIGKEFVVAGGVMVLVARAAVTDQSKIQ